MVISLHHTDPGPRIAACTTSCPASVEAEFGEVPELNENVGAGSGRRCGKRSRLIAVSALGALMLFADRIRPGRRSNRRSGALGNLRRLDA